jgi:hypothetical protein
MKYRFVIFILLVVSSKSFSQAKKLELEILPYVKYDKYKEFLGWETGVGGKHFITPSGLSFGADARMKKRFGDNYNLVLGLGYFRYSFTKITTHSNLGIGSARLINFQSPLFILFYTDKYWYNTVSLSLGVEKYFNLKNNFILPIGVNFSNYFSFSQHYHLKANPEGSQNYLTKKNKNLGTALGLEFGLLKTKRKMTIGPKLQIPFLSKWKTDKAFPNEDGNTSRSKWFKGFGIGISCNFFLPQKSRS